MHAALTVAAGGGSRRTQLSQSQQEVAVDARSSHSHTRRWQSMHAALTVTPGGGSRCTQLSQSQQEVAVDARSSYGHTRRWQSMHATGLSLQCVQNE